MKWSVKAADSHIRNNPEMPVVWHHIHGVLYKALESLWEETGDRKYFDYVRHNIDVLIDENGKIKDYPLTELKLDNINCGKVLFTLYKETHDERYKKALFFLKEHLRIQPTTKQGLYWHKGYMPYQSVLDGTYMYIPFLAEFEKTFNAPGYYDKLIDQVMTIACDTFDEKTGLYYQGYDDTHEIFWADDETGHSQCFWGRTIGWFAMTMVDLLDFIPASHPRRFEVVRLFADLMKAIVNVQDPESGVWYQVLDQGTREGNYLEASASGMFIYALAKGIRKGYLDREVFVDPMLKAYRGELKEFVDDNDGDIVVKHVCINVDLGATPADDSSYEFYINGPVGDDDLKGISTFLLASLEVEKLGYDHVN